MRPARAKQKALVGAGRDAPERSPRGESISASHVARHTASWEPPSLYTGTRCLPAPTPDDAEALYELFADEEVRDGLGREPVSAVDDVRAMIEAMIRGWRTEGLGPFILETAAADQQVVGQA